MRVLVAPDCFTGTLSASQAAAAIAQGWHRHAPGDDVELCPLSDGGPGFVEVLHSAIGGRLVSVGVRGPGPGSAAEVTASVLLVTGSDGAVTAYLETAQACGLHLVGAGHRDPRVTSTRGVGDLLVQARAAGATRIVLGLGGSGTNDAGAGMLAALAQHLDDDPAEPGQLSRFLTGGAALRGTGPADVAWLSAVRRSWAAVELVVASDVDSPLLGLHGASAGFAEQKGATAEQAQDLERCLGDFAAATQPAAPGAQRLSAQAGAGAAGGLGFGLFLLGATRVPGAQATVDAVDLASRLSRSDVVVTGEGCFDWQSLRGKVVAGVARAATQVGTPVVVVAGQVLVGRREAQNIGVDSAYAVAATADQVEQAMADPVGTLAARAERVARTWSRL